MIPRLQAFYGEVWGGWWNLPGWKLDDYSAALPRLQAERDLRQARLLDHMFPPRSSGEQQSRQTFLSELRREASEPAGGQAKSMPVMETVKVGMLSGLVEVVEGPPIAHGIGTRKAGYRSGE